MDIEANEIQSSVIIVFLVTLITSLIPPLVKGLLSRRRDSNVFKVSDGTTGSKTCMRHRKECASIENHLVQIVNFMCGGLLFGLLVLRLMPLTYRQFDAIYGLSSNTSAKSPVVTEEDVILLKDSADYSDAPPKKNLPYVELMISGFFFVIYFIEQLIQVRILKFYFDDLAQI